MFNTHHSSLPLILLVACFCVSQTPSTREYSLTISGSQTWTDTGVDLAAGDLIALTAEAKPGSDSACNSQGAAAASDANLPLPSAAAGALIAKTSDKADPTVIGVSRDLKPT